MTPKKPERDPNVVRIEIVEHEVSHQQQLKKWINGGPEPDRVRKIRENIKHTDLVLRGETSDAAWRKIIQERDETRFERETRHDRESGSRNLHPASIPDLGKGRKSGFNLGPKKGRSMNFKIKLGRFKW